MSTIGKEVLFLAATAQHSRMGEGAFIRLKDDRIMYAFTKFGGSRADAGSAVICALYSHDEGESWQDEHVLLAPDPGAQNLMSVSLLGLPDGRIAMFYLRKVSITDCVLHRAVSDDGVNFYGAAPCIGETYYGITNNDRVLRLSNNKIMFPSNVMTSPKTVYCFARFFISEDEGATFRSAGEPLSSPFEGLGTGLQETGIIELPDKRLWAWSRTNYGCQYEAFSFDEGRNWTPPLPCLKFPSPPSPMQIKNLPDGRMFAVFNPVPRHTLVNSKAWGRTPLICSVSGDEFHEEVKSFYIEDNLERGYCYPAVFCDRDYILTAYYYSDEKGYCLANCKITKIRLDELE